jgi:hypothetical protein
MKNNKKVLLVTIAIVAMILALAVSACAPKQSAGTDSPAAGTEATTYPVGSLMTVHADGVLQPDAAYVKKDCLACHPREAIVAANANYGGDEGVNPHAAHTEAYECTKCHSVAETSILVCNGCHSWALPDGWESAPNTTNSSLGQGLHNEDLPQAE